MGTAVTPLADISIREFTDEWIPAVRAFNSRLLAGGKLPVELAFPEHPTLDYPMVEGALVYQEPFLAVQGSEVRGGYYFTHERYRVGGEERWIANYRHPISEVLVNKSFKGLGSRLLSDARKRQPLLYSIGFGGEENPNLKRLVAEGWVYCKIPFFFRVARPGKFLAEMRPLRRRPVLRVAADAARYSGVGWIGIRGAQAVRSLGAARLPSTAETVEEFGPWADEIWQQAGRGFLLAAARDSATLRIRYPASSTRFLRLKVNVGGTPAGWAVLLTRQMNENKYFGNLCVGTVADCLAIPGCEAAVVRDAYRMLESLGADIIVSNQSASSWTRAFRAAGFWSAGSNYIFAASAELAHLIGPLDRRLGEYHLNRGDGAGISRL